MNTAGLISEGREYLAAARRLDSNPLVQLAQRRELRNSVLQPGWKRNAWVFLVCPGLFIIAVFISTLSRMSDIDILSNDTVEMLKVLSIVILAPAALLWLLGGLFKLSRDSIGWLSQIKDSGGAQMLDSMICISPLDDRDIILAGLRINVMPVWPRIIFAACVFCGSFVIALGWQSLEIQMQALMFLPLSIIAISLSGILGSILLGLYLSMVGLNLHMHLIVPLLSLLIAGLQIFAIAFGSVFFAEIARSEQLDTDLWPLVPVGLLAGLALFMLTVQLAYRGRSRQTWLLVVIPLLLPVTVSFMSLLGSLLGMGSDQEPFLAFFGNMMWVYNCFLPFSPFAAPSRMLMGTPVMEAWNSLAFEFWRWPLLTSMQLWLMLWLARQAQLATRDRRTPLS